MVLAKHDQQRASNRRIDLWNGSRLCFGVFGQSWIVHTGLGLNQSICRKKKVELLGIKGGGGCWANLSCARVTQEEVVVSHDGAWWSFSLFSFGKSLNTFYLRSCWLQFFLQLLLVWACLSRVACWKVASSQSKRKELGCWGQVSPSPTCLWTQTSRLAANWAMGWDWQMGSLTSLQRICRLTHGPGNPRESNQGVKRLISSQRSCKKSPGETFWKDRLLLLVSMTRPVTVPLRMLLWRRPIMTKVKRPLCHQPQNWTLDLTDHLLEAKEGKNASTLTNCCFASHPQRCHVPKSEMRPELNKQLKTCSLFSARLIKYSFSTKTVSKPLQTKRRLPCERNSSANGKRV